jgi:hypothetical protein
VLPTGLGKTETMLATQVYRRLDRSLVLVPSDALRRQIAKKPEKPGDRRDVNRPRDAFGGDCSDCGCRHGGYAASGAAGIAGSDCIHDARELRFWSVGWMYQDHFLQADISLCICQRRVICRFIRKKKSFHLLDCRYRSETAFITFGGPHVILSKFGL